LNITKMMAISKVPTRISERFLFQLLFLRFGAINLIGTMASRRKTEE